MTRDSLWRTHDQPPVLYAFCADEAVGQLLDFSGLAAKDYHLETVFMVEMGMQSGDDDGVRLVLEIGEFFRQQTRVVVVNESDGADNKGISGDHGGTNESVANQIAKRLRTILVALIRYKRIEPL